PSIGRWGAPVRLDHPIALLRARQVGAHRATVKTRPVAPASATPIRQTRDGRSFYHPALASGSDANNEHVISHASFALRLADGKVCPLTALADGWGIEPLGWRGAFPILPGGDSHGSTAASYESVARIAANRRVAVIVPAFLLPQRAPAARA